MQNEKQNNHIQQTVGQLQQLPEGFAFNSQKVWLGLEQQLPQLPVKKTRHTAWYYAAAAVLLVAGTAYFTVRTGNTVQVAGKLTAGLSVPRKQKTFATPIHKTNDQPANALPPAVKKHVLQVIAARSSEEKKTGKIKTEPALQVSAPAEQIVTEVPPVEQVNKEEKKKLPVITATKPAPKKYKVIHLNELMQSAIPDPQNTLSKSEFKKMMQQNEEKETAAPAENNTKQLFFFKIKPATTTNTISIVEN